MQPTDALWRYMDFDVWIQSKIDVLIPSGPRSAGRVALYEYMSLLGSKTNNSP